MRNAPGSVAASFSTAALASSRLAAVPHHRTRPSGSFRKMSNWLAISLAPSLRPPPREAPPRSFRNCPRGPAGDLVVLPAAPESSRQRSWRLARNASCGGALKLLCSTSTLADPNSYGPNLLGSRLRFVCSSWPEFRGCQAHLASSPPPRLFFLTRPSRRLYDCLTLV
jgi:hypothetical protein